MCIEISGYSHKLGGRSVDATENEKIHRELLKGVCLENMQSNGVYAEKYTKYMKGKGAF